MIEPYYQEDGITIYCARCEDVLPQLEPVDLCLTDPQYQLANGVRATTMNATAKRGRKHLKGTITIPKDWGKIHGDDAPFDPTMLLKCKRVILWGAIHYANRLPNSTSWLVWDKRCGVASDDNADGETAWTNLGGPLRIYRQLWKGICRAGQENIAIQGSKLHPFQKPIGLMTWCIQQADKRTTVSSILDPFMGSGTTLVAAKRLGRKAVGIEISGAYCKIAVDRLRQKELFGEPV